MQGKPANNSEFCELARERLRAKPNTDDLLQYDMIGRQELILSVTDLKHIQVITSPSLLLLSLEACTIPRIA
jgi:hypothetical protein